MAGAVAPGALLELGWPALGVGIELRVELVEPGRRLVFQSDDSRLELELSPGRVQLSHEAAFDDEDEREGTRSSWKMALATLAHFVEEHAGHTREKRGDNEAEHIINRFGSIKDFLLALNALRAAIANRRFNGAFGTNRLFTTVAAQSRFNIRMVGTISGGDIRCHRGIPIMEFWFMCAVRFR